MDEERQIELVSKVTKEDLQSRLAKFVRRVQVDLGDVSLRELARRTGVAQSSLQNAHSGTTGVALLLMLIELAQVWPNGGLLEVLAEIVEPDLIRTADVRRATSGLDEDLQTTIVQALERARRVASPRSREVTNELLVDLFKQLEAAGTALEEAALVFANDAGVDLVKPAEQPKSNESVLGLLAQLRAGQVVVQADLDDIRELMKLQAGSELERTRQVQRSLRGHESPVFGPRLSPVRERPPAPADYLPPFGEEVDK